MNKQKVEAEVLDVRPNGQHLLKLDSGKEIQGYSSGKMRHARIKVIIGDRVIVELDKYGGKVSNRIIRRL